MLCVEPPTSGWSEHRLNTWTHKKTAASRSAAGTPAPWPAPFLENTDSSDRLPAGGMSADGRGTNQVADGWSANFQPELPVVVPHGQVPWGGGSPPQGRKKTKGEKKQKTKPMPTLKIRLSNYTIHILSRSHSYTKPFTKNDEA